MHVSKATIIDGKAKDEAQINDAKIRPMIIPTSGSHAVTPLKLGFNGAFPMGILEKKANAERMDISIVCRKC